MQFFKKLLRGLTSLLFIFLLSATAVTTAFVLTFHSPKKIEQSLSASGVYSTFITNALNEAQKSNQQNNSSNNSDIPINDPAIVAAANKAFTPQLLQSTTENVLNGTYDWLSGKTQAPDFVIDFTQAKQTFADAVGLAAKNRVASLPVCTSQQLQTMGQNADINAFKITCQPRGINLSEQQQKVTNDLATSKDFLGTPKITPQNLPKNSKGQTVFDQIAQAPKVYKYASASPWILVVSLIVVAAIFVLLAETKRHGIKTLAIIMIVVGALLALGNIGSTQAFNHLNQSNGKIGQAIQGSFQQTIIKALGSISHSIEQIILAFGLLYLTLGIGALVTLKFVKPLDESEKKAKSNKEGPTPPIDDSPKQTEPKQTPKSNSQPASKPRTIQG